MSELNVLNEATDELIDVLRDKIKDFKCIVCKNDNFVMMDRIEDHLRSNVHLYSGPDPIPKKYIQLFTLICSSCGHIEQFAEKVLQDEIASKKASK